MIETKGPLELGGTRDRLDSYFTGVSDDGLLPPHFEQATELRAHRRDQRVALLQQGAVQVSGAGERHTSLILKYLHAPLAAVVMTRVAMAYSVAVMLACHPGSVAWIARNEKSVRIDARHVRVHASSVRSFARSVVRRLSRSSPWS